MGENLHRVCPRDEQGYEFAQGRHKEVDIKSRKLPVVVGKRFSSNKFVPHCILLLNSQHCLHGAYFRSHRCSCRGGLGPSGGRSLVLACLEMARYPASAWYSFRQVTAQNARRVPQRRLTPSASENDDDPAATMHPSPTQQPTSENNTGRESSHLTVS